MLAVSNKSVLTVLIYRTHVPNIKALYRAIELEITIDKIGDDAISIAANGLYGIDYVYINAAKQEWMLRVASSSQSARSLISWNSLPEVQIHIHISNQIQF